MQFLRNPRDAPPGNRSIWVSAYVFEWGIVLVVGCLIVGFYAFLARDKSATDIAIVIGAPMAILTALGGWSMQAYLSKSKSRGLKPGGPEQEDGP